MKPIRLLPAFAAAVLFLPLAVRADDLFAIGFEDYGAGDILDTQPSQSETYRWRMDKGKAVVQTNLVHNGKQALRLESNRAAITRRFDGGKDIQPLSSSTQYYDSWVYPACPPNAFTVVARFIDLTGNNFVDLYFANDGAIKLVAASGEKANPRKLVDSGAQWTPNEWHRLTLKMDFAAQKQQLWVNGKPVPAGPQPFAGPCDGRICSVTFEGPDAKSEEDFVCYDDLRWSDADPLNKKQP
ncbi:MAG: hypothetical protein HY360_26115 [Verrucomicrobia bacterium]|nr:hypothetical protein [Verrucomicrobiota bacterium]